MKRDSARLGAVRRKRARERTYNGILRWRKGRHAQKERERAKEVLLYSFEGINFSVGLGDKGFGGNWRACCWLRRSRIVRGCAGLIAVLFYSTFDSKYIYSCSEVLLR